LATWITPRCLCSGGCHLGEANYTLDPLSSTGVEKAMQNGCVAAVALHTLINRPDRAELCMRFYRDRQRETEMVHSDWRPSSMARSNVTRSYRSGARDPLRLIDPPHSRRPHW